MGNAQCEMVCCNQQASKKEEYTIERMDQAQPRSASFIANSDAQVQITVFDTESIDHTKYAETGIDELNILEYEQRVKMFASSQNKGFISITQLQEAFKDSEAYDHLSNPKDSKSKFIKSSFVANLPIGSGLDLIDRSLVVKKRYSKRTESQEMFFQEFKDESSIVDEYLEQIREQKMAKRLE